MPAAGHVRRGGAETRAFLAGHGVDLLAEQQTKTKRALEFFAEELAAAPAGA